MNDEKKKKGLATGVGLSSGAASGTAVGIIHSHDEAPLEVTEVEVQQVTIPEESPVLEVQESEVQQIVTPGEPVIDTPDDPVYPQEPIVPIDDMYGGPTPIDDEFPSLMYGGPEDYDDDVPVVMYGGPEDYDDDDPFVDDEDDDDDPLLDDDDPGLTNELDDIMLADDI